MGSWWSWHSDMALITDVVLEALKPILLKSELWAALIGATGGGLLTSRAANRQMRHERELTRDNARWAMGISTVREMLDPLETMRDLVDSLGVFNSTGKNTDPVKQGQAETALDIMERLSRTHAALLPRELYDRWFRAAHLARQYQSARRQQASASGWSNKKLARASIDVYNYMAYVSSSLSSFVQTGNVDAECEPPVLGRDDAGAWNPC